MTYVGAEDQIADAWIAQALAADAGPGGAATLVGGRLYQDAVPERSAPGDARYPCVRWQQLSAGEALNGQGAGYIMSEALYLVEAIAEDTESYADVAPVAARIYAALHQREAAIPGGVILACVRERGSRRAERVQGRSYRRMGHVFRISYQPA